MKKIISGFILFLFCFQAYSQQTQTPVFVTDSIEKYINWGITNWRIPGMAVAIIKDGKVVFMKGYGIKEHGLQDKVNENTLFMIGSNTKAFTATAMGLLESDKKLTLDDKVTKWLPYFKLENQLAGQQAIIRDLLCHRLGFGTFQGDFTYWTSELSRAQVIERMGRLKPKYEFRTRYGYTNAAFVAAGEIIPKVSGKSWELFVKERIFNPLGMNNTLALSKELQSAKNKSAAHTFLNGQLITIPYGALDNLAPAASISSSVEDMTKWVTMLLNGGRVGNREIVPEYELQQTWLPHSIIGNGNYPYNSGHFSLYGLGWFLEEYAGKKVISHTGGVNGFLSSVTLVPEEKLGIIVLTNTDQNKFYTALKWEILDSYLKLPYRNYSKIYLDKFKTDQAEAMQKDKRLRDSVAMQIRPLHSLNDYTGRYTNPVYGYVTVSKGENNGLEIRFENHPKLVARLQPLGADRFYAVYSDPVFGKEIIPFGFLNGKINSVKIKVDDFIEYDSYEFMKQ